MSVGLEEVAMKKFSIALVILPILLWVPTSYATGGHNKHYRGGYHKYHHGGYQKYRHGRHYGGYSRFRSSIFINYAPYWRPYYYGPRYYPTPVIVQAPATPSVYVEKSRQQPYYWYYCTDPEGYYPYVKQCPPGWMQVVPQSPPR